MPGAASGYAPAKGEKRAATRRTKDGEDGGRLERGAGGGELDARRADRLRSGQGEEESDHAQTVRRARGRARRGLRVRARETPGGNPAAGGGEVLGGEAPRRAAVRDP